MTSLTDTDEDGHVHVISKTVAADVSEESYLKSLRASSERIVKERKKKGKASPKRNLVFWF